MLGKLEVAKWLKANCPACQAWTLQQPEPRLASFLGNLRSYSTNVCMDLDLLRWILKEYDIADNLYRLIGHAVISGSQECLQFLMSQPEKYHQAARHSNVVLHPLLMELAAEHGRLEMLPTLSTITGLLLTYIIFQLSLWSCRLHHRHPQISSNVFTLMKWLHFCRAGVSIRWADQTILQGQCMFQMNVKSFSVSWKNLWDAVRSEEKVSDLNWP